MKTVIIFSGDIKQINFTPETDDEKLALKMITVNDDISLAVKWGAFGESRFEPFGVSVNKCIGGYLRDYDSGESLMLILSPKSVEEVNGMSAEEIAENFTVEKFRVVNTMLSDDYKTGYKEGIQHYLEAKNK